MSAYDYENYFSKPDKLEYWQNKKWLDQVYLVPLVNSDLKTLNIGAGLFVEQETLKIKDVVCVDISETAIEALSKRGIIGYLADAKVALPFCDNYFKQVLMLDTFEHLGQINKCISEIKRVLKPEGRLVLGLPLLNYWKNYLQLLFQTTSGVQHDEHCRMFFDKDIRNIFSNAGFRLEHAEYVGLTHGYGYYVFVNNKMEETE